MIKKPFFGFLKPRLQHTGIESLKQKEIKQIPIPDKVTLFLEGIDARLEDLGLRQGAEVNTGERLPLFGGKKEYLIASVTGTVEAISESRTFTDQRPISVAIRAADKDRWDTRFTDASESPGPEVALDFLGFLPGISDFPSLIDIENPFHTLIVNGMDHDLLVCTNQILINAEPEGIKEGVAYLKTVSGASRVILAVPPSLSSAAAKIGEEIRVIDPVYPNILPWFLVRDALDQDIPANKHPADLGIGVINAEAVLALKTAFDDKRVPVEKVVSVIGKDARVTCVRTRIGTPVRDILDALNISTVRGDRIVLGGPMTGRSIYSEEMPVTHNTDAIFIQDHSEVIPGSDSPCVNCGECVRACPARLPVNMLVRLLENGLYEEAAQAYNLLSCVECGLCSYVCMLHIPVFHYMMLGKHELALRKAAEESNG
jgi:Na+-translocating ferredoxin:NAD+ oxidoreductase subunit C